MCQSALKRSRVFLDSYVRTPLLSNDNTAARLAALHAKRDRLRAEQAARTAHREHAEHVAHFQRGLGAALDRAGVRYEALWDDAVRPSPLALYPIGFASVRWDRVPQAVSAEGYTDAGQKTLLDEALCALGLAPTDTVIVDWLRHGEPRLALSVADVSAHGLALIQHGSDMWVYADGSAWLIEIYHEGTVSYADRPGAPEHAGDGWRRLP